MVSVPMIRFATRYAPSLNQGFIVTVSTFSKNTFIITIMLLMILLFLLLHCCRCIFVWMLLHLYGCGCIVYSHQLYYRIVNVAMCEVCVVEGVLYVVVSMFYNVVSVLYGCV